MRKPSNKEKILAQAQLRLDAGTFDEMTVRELCQAAGVSIGSFYHYFQSIDDLIIEFYLSNAQRVETLRQNQLQNLAVWDALRTYLEFQIQGTLNTPVKRLKYIYTYNINHTRLPLERQRAVIRELLEKAQAQGQMKMEFECEDIVNHFLILVIGNMIRYCIEDGHYDLRGNLSCQVEHLIQLIAVSDALL